MPRTLLLFLIMMLPVMAFAQEVLFDEPHLTDGSLHIRVDNGREVAYNAAGEMVEPHPVFLLPMHERKSSGKTIGITAPDHSLLKQDGFTGPTFNLTYLDVIEGTGQGFAHPTEGAARRAALEAAFAHIASSLLDGGQADIEIRTSFSGNPNSNPFAFASSYYFGSKGFNDPFTKRHIITGNDPHGVHPDAYLQFNFHGNLKYNYDIYNWPAADQYDFFTVALHEIMHILGFASYCNHQGESAAAPDVFTTYDGNLVDFEKNTLLEMGSGGGGSAVISPSPNLLTNNQVWYEIGPGALVPVFSPSTFGASSLSHLDNSRSDHGEYVMHPSLSKGQRFAYLHEDEAAILETLGYSVNLSLATSLEDDEDFGGFSTSGEFSTLYPNPATSGSAIQIDAPQVDAPEILVIVYDMLGRESYSKVVMNAGPGPLTAIDPYHNLKPGMYIVVGSSRNELFNQKLVIR